MATTTRSISGVCVRIVGHLLAVLTITGGFAVAFLNEAVWSLMVSGAEDSQVLSSLIQEGMLLFGLAACFWAMLFIAYLYIKAGLESRRKLAIVRTRGSIITETLIVFPVFLLLTFGLAQMAVNSMAGLLTTLGVYQAARTMAVWGPEIGHNRTGSGTVQPNDVRERGRIAASAVITPVAPAMARSMTCNESQQFRQMVRGMTAAGLSPTAIPTPAIKTFTEALSDDRFAVRGPSQFKAAYCQTSVTFDGNFVTDMRDSRRNDFTTTVTYNHKIAFPLVGAAFGTRTGGAFGVGGYSTTVKRSYKMTQFLSPNPRLPKTTDIF
jgi:hypothetical protein